MKNEKIDLNKQDSIHTAVQEGYSEVAARTRNGDNVNARQNSEIIGYDLATLDSIPKEANLGVGCGNPTALAALQSGETVVDIGAGAGLDALIAANKVGPEGRVIGVDMTLGMLTSARKNAVKMDVHGHVEFREGFAEELPVVSESADVVISNCVINLCPDKARAFREAFRVLKSKGRLAITDIVLSSPMPADIVGLVDAYVGCISGAATEEEYLQAIRDAGFVNLTFTRIPAASLFLGDFSDPLVKQAIESIGQERVTEIANSVWSYKITAEKP